MDSLSLQMPPQMYLLASNSMQTLDETLNSIDASAKMMLQNFDEHFNKYKPSTLILLTLFAVLTINIINKLRTKLSLGSIIRVARSLPIVRGIVDSKLEELGIAIKNDLFEPYAGEEFIEQLPAKPACKSTVLNKTKHYQSFDSTSFQNGRISGTIYSQHTNPDYKTLLSQVYETFMWSNPLHADVFAGVRKMEIEIVRMVTSMYKGDKSKVVGCLTSGGTESIVMACKAYRNLALRNKKFSANNRPEIVVPVTAHAAFEKAANFLNCHIKFVPINEKTLKVNLKLMEAAITSNTCMLVGSAPQFPHGIIDPIIEIGKIGIKHKIPVHVDACLGGFLLPFMNEAGFALDEKFDFTVEGVTSISCDSHKYGYSPKGTSILMYSDKKYIHEQYSIQTNWPGGVYASPSLPGSRPGGLIATCWAAMLFHGHEGYVQATKSIMESAAFIKKELDNGKVKGLQVMGKPFASVLAFNSDTFNVLMLNDKLKGKGWVLNVLQFPPSFHLCVTQVHNRKVAENFVRDVIDCSQELILDPNLKPAKQSSAAMYGLCQNIPDRSIVSDVCKLHLDACLGK